METEQLLQALNTLQVGYDKIITQLDKLKILTSAEIAAEYVDIKTINDKHSEVGKVLSSVVDRLKHEILPEAFDREGLSSFTTKSGYRVTTSVSVRANISDKINGYEWLQNNGLADIITQTVNASTLSAVARNLLEEGKELPQEYFKTYMQNTTSVTKVSK